MRNYLLRYTSDYIYNDDQLVKAKNIKHAIKSAKLNLKWLVRDYLETYEFEKIYKRHKVDSIYQDTKTGRKNVGKAVSVIAVPKGKNNKDFENEAITVYVFRLTQKDLIGMMDNKFITANSEGYTE